MAIHGSASAGAAFAMLSPRSSPMGVPSASSTIGRGPIAAPALSQALGLAAATREAGAQQRGKISRHAVPLLALETVAAAAISVIAFRPSKKGRQLKQMKKLRKTTRPVPWNIYSPKTPLKGKLTKNYGVPRNLTGEHADEEVCHLTFDHGGAYFFVEGQVVGVQSASANPESDAPASMKFYSVASSPRGDDETSTTMSICVRRTPPPTAAEEAAVEQGLANGHTKPAEAEAAEAAEREPSAPKEGSSAKGSLPDFSGLQEIYAKAKSSIPEVEKLDELLTKAKGSIPEVEKLDEILTKAKGSIPEVEKFDEILEKAKGSIPEVGKLDEMLAKATGSIPKVDNLDRIFKNFLRTVNIVDPDDARQEKAQKLMEEDAVSAPAVKEVDNVKVATDLCDLESGDEVIMTGPSGVPEALLPDDPQANLIMIATGTGIAPMRSYCRTLFHDTEGLDFISGKRKFKGLAWLIYGAPAESSLLYHDEHLHYAAMYRAHFRYDHSTPKSEGAGTLSALREKVYLYHGALWDLLQDKQTHLVVSAVRGVEELLREALNPIAIDCGSDWYTLRETLIEEGRYHVEEQ